MGRGGAEPPGFQTVTDYLIYTSRLCNSYYMAIRVSQAVYYASVRMHKRDIW